MDKSSKDPILPKQLHTSKQYGTELRQMREPNPQPKTIIHQIPRWHACPSKRASCIFWNIAHRHRGQSQRIMNPTTDCTRTCNRLKLFWNKTRTSIKWKVQIFHSIVKSKMMYGLETIQLNLTDQKKINSFQVNGYQRILHIPPTYIDRTMTNDHVKYQIWNRLNTQIKMPSSMWQRKISLLGHIIN
jgi:hypothetical protein